MSYQKFYPQRTPTNSAGPFITGFLTGALVGVAVGVLLAPHRGDVTRRKLSRQAGAKRDQIAEAVEDLIERREKTDGEGDAEE